MTRPYLDPTQTEGARLGPTIERLPASVREFGFFPDCAKLQPGDLVLVRSTRMTSNVRLIEASQHQRHDAYDAQWIHAAAYLGDSSLVEIDQSGVNVADLHKYVGGHRIQVRRPLDIHGAAVDLVTGYQIAVSALKMFKTSYDQGGIVTVIKRYWSRGSDYALHPKSQTAICSDYYNDAVARVLGRGAVSAKVNPFTPADLSASAHIQDVMVDWRRLP